ncbi:MAG TPA: sigma-54 dependent transcriptional regulator, partial [Polyangiaceae bacterium]|nr:sigma-54 dependent transcriptional regulator [Polyangiaceae bacterium]
MTTSLAPRNVMGSMAKVLIVDDQGAVRTALEVLFQIHGLETLSAATPQEALALITNDDVGVVVQDMNFSEDTTSGQEGIGLFRQIHALDPDLPVLLMTAWTSLETAVELVKEGAADYIGKPWDDAKLVLSVQNLLRLYELQRENVRLRSKTERERSDVGKTHELCGLVYASAEMQNVVSLTVRVAASDVPILITGPNGCGKERIAEILQANSRRAGKPFVKVNAGGLPDNLLEAELFGAEAGAFTGSTKLRIGRFEAAQGGTLFLDEVGNLSATGQMRLLRVLQTGEFERLGSSTTRKIDVRVVSATNADLKREIKEGRFREDLYFRLNVIELELPPLCERPDDILPLARHFLQANAADGAPLELDASAERALLRHDWPGNVRELENRMRRAILIAQGGVVRAADFALEGSGGTVREGRASQPAPPPSVPPSSAKLTEMDEAERLRVEEALKRAGGVVSRAAAELGMSRQALYRRMERLGLAMERRV